MKTTKRLFPRLDAYRPIPEGVSAQIDTLRGLSAIAVLFAHCNQVFISPSYHGLYAIMGIIAQASVMVFFVLSGFLIGKSLTRNASSAEGFSFKRYAIDRVNRIYPPLVFSIAILLAMFFFAPYIFPTGDNTFIKASGYAARDGFHLDASSVLGSLLFLNGFFTENISSNGPLWSLSYEVWYYIAAGFIFLYRGEKRIIIFTATMLALGYFNKIFILYSTIWFAGLVVCILHNNNLFNKKSCIAAAVIFGMPAIALAGFYVYTFGNHGSLSKLDMRVVTMFNLFFGMSASALFLLLVNECIKISPVLRSSSEFSYTLYVTHFPVILFIYGSTQALTINNIINSTMIGVGTAAFCILMANIAARHIEKARPFSALKAIAT